MKNRYRVIGDKAVVLVNHKGDVLEKDLGQGTAKIAAGMTSFNPDDTWKRVAVTEEKR